MALTVAIVGAGPSGLYAAEALASQPGVQIDVFDRLPVPMGLVRYGVAPDHFSIRGVRDTLDKTFDQESVHFIGNIEVGKDISLADVREAYHAVILTYGASRDRALGIEGEDLQGSIAATDFVAWYTGHPDADPQEFTSLLANSTSVAVVGVGNVAIDVARILIKDVSELASTDMPRHVLDALENSAVRDVHIVGRRGPLQASFTTKELRELGELSGVEVVVDTRDLVLDAVSLADQANNKVAARNFEVLREWSERASGESPRSIHFHFFAKPTVIAGAGRVEELIIQRTAFDETGRLVDVPGETASLRVDAVVRSIGYRGVPLEGVPFDTDRGIVRNVDGRVEGMPGVYVAGWIKRGPSGIIGTNKKDAAATIQCLLADSDSLPAPTRSIESLLSQQRIVDTAGWRSINEAEKEAGAREGRDRLTLHTRDMLMTAAST